MAAVITTRKMAAAANERMPFEKTSRWPRFVSWRGMKLSPAWKLASRGKSAKLVLAASTRMSIVPAWRLRYRTCPTGPLPKTTFPIWEITVGVPLA